MARVSRNKVAKIEAGEKLPVSRRALMARIDRALAKNGRKLESCNWFASVLRARHDRTEDGIEAVLELEDLDGSALAALENAWKRISNDLLKMSQTVADKFVVKDQREPWKVSDSELDGLFTLEEVGRKLRVLKDWEHLASR